MDSDIRYAIHHGATKAEIYAMSCARGQRYFYEQFIIPYMAQYYKRKVAKYLASLNRLIDALNTDATPSTQSCIYRGLLNARLQLPLEYGGEAGIPLERKLKTAKEKYEARQRWYAKEEQRAANRAKRAKEEAVKEQRKQVRLARIAEYERKTGRRY